MQSARGEAGVLAVDVPEDWMQGRSVFGGLQVAIAVRAMRALVPDAVLRTLQTTFMSPVQRGLVRARAQVLRRGKSATHVEARLVDGAETLALVLAVFGTPRSSTVRVAPAQPPVEADKFFELHFIPGLMPNFTQHFAVRWIRGGPPFSGDTALDHVLEVGIRDEGQATESHAISIADFVPPLALSHLSTPAPGSTLTWMLEFLVDRVDQFALSGWRVDAQLVAAHDGYTSQSVMLWGPAGVPVATSHQAMLVFG
jgi:acyl-CoA thioesterase